MPTCAVSSKFNNMNLNVVEFLLKTSERVHWCALEYLGANYILCGFPIGCPIVASKDTSKEKKKQISLKKPVIKLGIFNILTSSTPQV